MNLQPTAIDHIPAIIWGKKSDKAYIHVHGKMSCKEAAEPFAQLAQDMGYQTLSFDLPQHGERIEEPLPCDIWNGMHDLRAIADYAFSKWTDVSLFACSLGAFFSLNAYTERNFTKCLFQSPIIHMEWLIQQMFLWFDISEEKLRAEKEIFTPIDTLRWDYYQYVLSHPITAWKTPTAILYAGQDNLQPAWAFQEFAQKHHCKLTLSPGSEHPFMGAKDAQIVLNWLRENL